MPINLKNLLIKQAFAISLNASLEQDVHNLDLECEKLAIETFKKYDLYKFIMPYIQIRLGFMHKSWSPHFLISSIDSNIKTSPYSKEHVFILINDNWFAIPRGISHLSSIPIHKIDFAQKMDHIDLNKLKAACNELTEKTGFPVKFTEHTVENIPNTTLQLIEKHGGSTLVCMGTKNGEPWAILRTKNQNLIVYYSTNGHGFGYDKCLKHEHSKDEFFTWLGDKTEVESLIPEKILAKLKTKG